LNELDGSANSISSDQEEHLENESDRKHKKTDQGFKSLLRGLRKCWKDRFLKSPFSSNFHRLSDEDLYERIRFFSMSEPTLRYIQLNDKTIWVLVAFASSVRAISPSSEKGRKGMRSCLPLHRALGDKGLRIYRDVFGNNHN
jgi:hypothetical protein